MAEYVVDFYSEHDGVKCEPIVRCRDCEYATNDGYGCKFFSHYEQGAYYQWEDVPAEVEPEGFCKWAKRAESGPKLSDLFGILKEDE